MCVRVCDVVMKWALGRLCSPSLLYGEFPFLKWYLPSFSCVVAKHIYNHLANS